MKAVDIPAKFPIPWGNSAGGSYIRTIPTASQIGITDGRASLTDGWVPLNFTDIAVGGVPPSGKDDNGIKNQITANIRWQSAGMHPVYDSTFSTAIGGYPIGAILQSADLAGFWISTADDNTTNPDTGGAGWVYCVMRRDLLDARYIQSASSNLSYKKWVADSIGINNYNCVISADSVDLMNSSGIIHTETAVSKTINLNGTVGNPLSVMSTKAANTWYYIWMWYNVSLGSTATLDTSSTSPTAPAGYVSIDFKALMPGEQRTDASKYLKQLKTRGRRTDYAPLGSSNVLLPPLMASGTASQWTNTSYTSYLPPTAKIGLFLIDSGSEGGSVALAANSAYAGGRDTFTVNNYSSESSATILCNILLQSSSYVYWSSSNSDARLMALGWESNI